MYCLSLRNKDLEKTLKIIADYDMAEIRLDLSQFKHSEITKLCQAHSNLIFTFREKDHSQREEKKDLLMHAIDSGAAWIDLDIDQDENMIASIKEKLSEKQNAKFILSYHNFERVPSNQELFEIMIRAGSHEADLIKLACFSNGHRDNKRIIKFNESFSNVIAFNMGEKGRFTRILCLMAGAPFTYVSYKGEATASGQMDRQSMEEILNKYYKN